MELVLTEKIPHRRRREFLAELEARLRDISSGLNVNVEMKGLTESRMPRIQVSGEDEEAFTEVLRHSLGIAPREYAEALRMPVLRGFVQKPSSQDDALLIDVGFRPSSPFQVVLRAERLRAQLFNGHDVPLRRMVERYGFFEDFPVELRIVSTDEDSRQTYVELSDRQWSTLVEWDRIPLDRIIAQDVLEPEVRREIRRINIERDLAAVESLSLGTHCLICKLGTNGRGLIPKLGPHLKARLFVFHPSSRSKGEPLKRNLSK